jgi:hypothetical protein
VSVGAIDIPVAPEGDKPDGDEGSATTVVNEDSEEAVVPAAFEATTFQE